MAPVKILLVMAWYWKYQPVRWQLASVGASFQVRMGATSARSFLSAGFGTPASYYPIIIAPQRFRTPVVDELLAAGRQPSLDAIDRFREAAATRLYTSSSPLYTLFRAFNRKPTTITSGGARILHCFFEVAVLTQAQRHYAASFDIILAGSKYNEQEVEHGITTLVRTATGVDTTLFRGSSTRTDVDVETQKLLQLPNKAEMQSHRLLFLAAVSWKFAKGRTSSSQVSANFFVATRIAFS